VVDVDAAELFGKRLQRTGYGRAAHGFDRIQQPSMEDDRHSVTPVVLEVRPLSIQ